MSERHWLPNTNLDPLALTVVFVAGVACLFLWPHRTVRMLLGGDWEPKR